MTNSNAWFHDPRSSVSVRRREPAADLTSMPAPLQGGDTPVYHELAATYGIAVMELSAETSNLPGDRATMDDIAQDVMRIDPERPALSGAKRALEILTSRNEHLADQGLDDVRDDTLAAEELVDAVADLYHLAYRNGLHPDDVHRDAATHWHSETGDAENELNERASNEEGPTPCTSPF